MLQPVRAGEWVDDGVVEALRMLRLPSVFRRLYAWYWRYLRRDALYAALVDVWREKSVEEYFALVAAREGIRERWFALWDDARLDFVLTVPNSLPAVPHGGMRQGWSACGYTFLFNIVSGSGRSQSRVALTPSAARLFRRRPTCDQGRPCPGRAARLHAKKPVGSQAVPLV